MPKRIVVPEGIGVPIAPFSPSVLADGVLYLSGTLAIDKDNSILHPGDVAAQTRRVLETIKSVVSAT